MYIYIYTYIYLYIYIYIYIYIYKVKKTDNVPSRLLPIHQWPHGNSCTWAHDVRLWPYNRTLCAQVHELPWGHWQIIIHLKFLGFRYVLGKLVSILVAELINWGLKMVVLIFDWSNHFCLSVYPLSKVFVKFNICGI